MTMLTTPPPTSRKRIVESSSPLDDWGQLNRTLRRHGSLLLMLIPAIVFFLIFSYVPMAGLIIAFKNYTLADGILGSPWCGLENFRRLFGGSEFMLALRNTLVISLLRMGVGFFAPIILALMLNELRLAWYKRTIQTLTYLPHFISWVILGSIFIMLFSLNGPINQLVLLLGGNKPIEFLSDNVRFVVVLIVTGVWQSAGYGAVVYLAALSGIDPGLYEAANIDGAGRWKQTIHVTLPALLPTIVTLFILSFGGVLNAGFDQIYNMYNPMVYDASDILDTYVLRRMVAMDFALATAAGMFKSVVGLVLIILVNSIARKLSDGEQGVW